MKSLTKYFLRFKIFTVANIIIFLTVNIFFFYLQDKIICLKKSYTIPNNTNFQTLEQNINVYIFNKGKLKINNGELNITHFDADTLRKFWENYSIKFILNKKKFKSFLQENNISLTLSGQLKKNLPYLYLDHDKGGLITIGMISNNKLDNANILDTYLKTSLNEFNDFYLKKLTNSESFKNISLESKTKILNDIRLDYTLHKDIKITNVTLNIMNITLISIAGALLFSFFIVFSKAILIKKFYIVV